MSHHRILLCLITASLAFAGGSTAQEAAVQPNPERDSQLAMARVLLADFQKVVDTDDEKADEAFAALLEMPEFIQQGFGRYLEAEWEERFKQYRQAAGFGFGGGDGGGAGAAISQARRNEARDNQKLLAEIRTMADEEEMKEVLKSKGYPALESLLRIIKPERGSSSGGSLERKADPLASIKQVAALRIGKYRQKLYQHFGSPLPETPEQQLGLAPAEERAEDGGSGEPVEAKLVASAADRRILEKNEELFSKIEPAEAEGIRQLNEWRIAVGLNPLEVDPLLCDAARDHSKDMAEKGFFDHSSPVEGKKSFTDRARNFGTTARAENIAINNSPASANTAWFFSPGHHKNMFANHTIVGLGNHGRHYTQMFR